MEQVMERARLTAMEQARVRREIEHAIVSVQWYKGVQPQAYLGEEDQLRPSNSLVRLGRVMLEVSSPVHSVSWRSDLFREPWVDHQGTSTVSFPVIYDRGCQSSCVQSLCTLRGESSCGGV
ncbi:unnamed protein product [Brassica napus]|uniref:(rape) hypothetical protein n=1 Tax=Brassica napus TaxID=3708 RepID=A0A816UG00_BRANA|nr:unnamed protein product [Brassica napus]